MKKLFTIDDFMVAFISALGYGLGYTVPMHLGWPQLACIAVCFVLGIALEAIISRIVFSKTVQKNTANRVCTYAAIVLVFLSAQYGSMRWLGASLLEDLQEEFAFVVGLPLLGLVVSLLIRGYRVRKIRKLYGDGNEGYVFDVKQEDLAETNQANQPIRGAYDASLAVKTRTGVYVGEKYKKTVAYLGIPYAKPPVGARRWKAPEPLPDSEAVFEAKNFGASAIQVAHKGSLLKLHRQSEDCLTLNISAAAEKTERKREVLVLFHGGDFTYGGSVDPLFYGGEFAAAHPDIVFVSFNYRLGIFGFIDFSLVPGGEDYPDTLNLGLLDQIAALKWIKGNIAAFGGDPEQITVLGFDAGATSILLLAHSGQAKGLFRRAFLFNGSPAAAYNTPEASRSLAQALLKETNTATMAELSQLETKALQDAAQRLWRNMCAPTCDGIHIPADLYRASQDGLASGIEFIIGFSSREANTYRAVLGDQSYGDFLSAALADLRSSLDASTAAAVQAYIDTQKASSTELAVKSKLLEQWNALCIYRLAVKLYDGGNTVYLMEWDEKPLLENLGSGTVDAAAALLGNGDALQIYGSVLDADLSEALQALLQKYIQGNALELYRNEISGVDAFDWKPFPQALIVSDGEILCDTIEDRITEVKALLEYMVQ